MDEFVVGIDGSQTSIEALRWAIEEAKLRGATIDAVNAWNYPVVVVPGAIVPLEPTADQAIDVQVELNDALDAVDADNAAVPINPIVAEGPAATVLRESAKDADLLVVGSTGKGGLRGLLLGSVSKELLHHPPCPVVVIPHVD